MSIWVKIFGESGNQLKINGEGEASVVVHPHPPIDETLDSLPFRQYFTDDGSSSGSNDMGINGVTTPTKFYVRATPEYNIYIKYISVLIGDGGSPALNKFGNLSALTNGVRWSWDSQGAPDYELHDGIKSNIEFVRLGGDTPAVGTGTDAFLSDVSGGGTEKSYLIQIDLSETFGKPWGVRLKKGTLDALSFEIRDDLTSLTTFNAIAYGIRI